MPLVGIHYIKELDINSEGDTSVRMRWTFRNEGASDVLGLFRYRIVSVWETQNIRDLSYDRSKVEVRRDMVGKKTRLELAPLRNKLSPNEEFSIELNLRSSDLVEHFDNSGLSLFRDVNMLGEIPDVPEATIEGVSYPSFTTRKSYDYVSKVKLPPIQAKPWENTFVGKWSSGIGNPSDATEGKRRAVTYRFALHSNDSKEYSVLYGKQPRGIPWLTSALSITFVAAAVAVSSVIAIGITFHGVDPVAGGAIIGALIGGEAVLKWLSSIGKLTPESSD